MKARKTVNVSRVVGVANKLLALPDDERAHINADFRHGVTAVLEALLHDANAYKGFNYLAWLNKEGRELSGCDQWRVDNKKAGFEEDPGTAEFPSGLGWERRALSTETYLGDQSRRVYYY